MSAYLGTVRGILLQTQYAQSPEAMAVRTAVLMAANGMPVFSSADPGERASDLPVGSVAYVLAGLRERRMAQPPVLNYPQALRAHLQRDIWPSILGKEIGGAAWVKAAGHDKPFMPGLASRPELLAFDPQTPVFASEPVRWLCEWRCYVAGGRLLWRGRYDHDGADDAPEPSPPVIDAMIAAYQASGEAPAGYALDVGVLSDPVRDKPRRSGRGRVAATRSASTAKSRRHGPTPTCGCSLRATSSSLACTGAVPPERPSHPSSRTRLRDDCRRSAGHSRRHRRRARRQPRAESRVRGLTPGFAANRRSAVS